MINNKGTISSLVIGTLIFFGIIIIFFNFYGNIRDEYGVTIEGNESQFYQNVSDLADRVYGYTENITEETKGSQPTTYEQATGFQLMTSSIWNAIKVIFLFIPIFLMFINNVGVMLGIPYWLMNIIIGIVITSITFVIINAVFRRDT